MSVPKIISECCEIEKVQKKFTKRLSGCNSLIALPILNEETG